MQLIWQHLIWSCMNHGKELDTEDEIHPDRTVGILEDRACISTKSMYLFHVTLLSDLVTWSTGIMMYLRRACAERVFFWRKVNYTPRAWYYNLDAVMARISHIGFHTSSKDSNQ